MIHVHQLRGCVPTILAHYLKALGVLRLVATQADPQARGFWRDESFHLVTLLDRKSLLDFFAHAYAPTPLLAPWNGGSGFYPKDNQAGINAIRSVAANRFKPYQAAIAMASEAVIGREESPKNDEKQALLGQCRRTWRGPVLDWLDAVVVIGEELAPAYPSLLGSGGNDGRLDFTNNFMQRLGDLLDMGAESAPAKPTAVPLLASALYADQPTPGLSSGAAIGQFLPGSAGGANSTSGFSGDSLINPWDFVLMLEGSICFASALSRRLRDGESAHLAAPFAIYSKAVGFGTATPSEESARGEQWLPLWGQPAAYTDLSALIAEGRCQHGRSSVRRPLEMASALARHGTARGITAFQRFGFLERNGQSNFAIPLGRWSVSPKPHPHQTLAEEASGWIEHIEFKAREKNAPISWQRASRMCSEALMGVCRDSQPMRWKTLFIALGAAERVLATTHAKAGKAGLRPLPKLSAGWIDRIGGSSELRLALAIADQSGLQRHGTWDFDDTVRHHWQAIDGNRIENHRFAERANTGVISDCVNPLEWLARLVRIRAIRESPLIGHRHVAGLNDVAGFLRGDVQAGTVLDFLGPCLALDRQSLQPLEPPYISNEDLGGVSTYGLLRLATMSATLELSGYRVQTMCDQRVTLALCAGALDRAVDLAGRRLRHNRLRPFIDRTFGGIDQARTLAAALAIPLSHRDAAMLAQRLTKPTVNEITVTYAS